jgi:hypothetical protein
MPATGNVAQIHEAIKTTAGVVLGGSYVLIRNVYELDKNDTRTSNYGYGVKHLASSIADGVTRTVTMDQGFELILMNRIVRRDNDSEIQAVINTLHDKVEAFFQSAYLTKLGLSSIVLNVENLNITEPQIFESGLVALTATFTVKHRKQIT